MGTRACSVRVPGLVYVARRRSWMAGSGNGVAGVELLTRKRRHIHTHRGIATGKEAKIDLLAAYLADTRFIRFSCYFPRVHLSLCHVPLL